MSPSTPELLTDDDFWALVALARRDEEAFQERLEALSTAQLAGFVHMFYGFECELFDPALDLLGSEDSAEDFCGWVVAQGKAFYLAALRNPESLDEDTVERFDDDERPGIDIRYQAAERYRSQTGQSTGEYNDPWFDALEVEEYRRAIQQGGRELDDDDDSD